MFKFFEGIAYEMSFTTRRMACIFGFCVAFALLFADSSSTGVGIHEERINIFKVNQTSSIPSRSGSNGIEDGRGGSDGSSGSVKRIGPGCSLRSIDVTQGQTPPLPSGIPTYTATVENICVPGCTISNIHLTCGWFSSARLINPRVFRRLSYNDCLVNNGQPLGPGQTISFQYANTYSYPLAVSSFTCINNPTIA